MSHTKKSAARRKPARTKGQPRIRGRVLAVGNRRVPLYSGAVHYWRLDPDDWGRALGEVHNLGLPIVETYVPWGVHETGPGEFDFGERDPQKDVGRFLDLAREAGLLAFVRPGPHINAEMTYFGLPERVVYDKACQARSPRQNAVILPFPPRMFPVPSYASSNYHRETGRWYDAVASVVAPRLWPKGPVVLVQVDNEAAYYFRNGPYDQDYHPDAIALYRKHLEERYGSLAQLAKVHRQKYATWDDVLPPERFEARTPAELVVHLDWARFHEHLVTQALGRMKRRMARAGIKGLPVVHNVPLGEGGLPLSMTDIAKVVDLTGLDYYHAAREHRTIKRRTLYLAGTFELPYSPEMGVGAPPWFTPLSHDDSLFCAMSACAYGLRGMNLYMAVDRDRWYGAPIEADGTPRVEAGVWKHLLSELSAVRFHELERRVEVALVVPPEYRRLSRATHLLGGIVSPSAMEALGGTPVDACREDDLGFKGPIQVLWWRMLAKMSDALTRAGVPYVYVDGDAPSERLAGMRVVVAPSYEFASPERWKRLCAAAKHATLVYGPAMPELDLEMRPHPFEVPRGGRRVLLDVPEDAERLVDDLVEELDLARPFRVTPAPVETAVHEDAVGPRVLFVIHPDRRPVTATVELPAPMTLVDLMSRERLSGTSRVEIPMRPQSVRMLLVEPEEDDALRAGNSVPRARRSAS